MKVDVYWNLNKKIFSVRNRRTGRVELYSDLAEVYDARFIVQPSGYRRVLRTGRKNVHAFVRGSLGGWIRETDVDYRLEREARYNPFESSYFRDTLTGHPIDGASLVLCVVDDEGRPRVFYE